MVTSTCANTGGKTSLSFRTQKSPRFFAGFFISKTPSFTVPRVPRGRHCAPHRLHGALLLRRRAPHRSRCGHRNSAPKSSASRDVPHRCSPKPVAPAPDAAQAPPQPAESPGAALAPAPFAAAASAAVDSFRGVEPFPVAAGCPVADSTAGAGPAHSQAAAASRFPPAAFQPLAARWAQTHDVAQARDSHRAPGHAATRDALRSAARPAAPHPSAPAECLGRAAPRSRSRPPASVLFPAAADHPGQNAASARRDLRAAENPDVPPAGSNHAAARRDAASAAQSHDRGD